MPRGPLPEKRRARRNKPTIPTTTLPGRGRKGRIPKPPEWVELGGAGREYWDAAWRTPQSAAWGIGMGFEPLVARRAMLEDDLAAVERADDVGDLLAAVEDERAAQQIRFLIQRLLALSTGRLAIVQKMLDIEDRLGLTPKALAQLRWEIVDDEPAQEEVIAPGVPSISARRARIAGAG